jgi:UDP-N-acetylglucosamine--dolichyl-phosphate N-acetylglucosaminephosphotransferase
MDVLIIITIVISFLCSFLVLPLWIKKAKKIKLVGRDIHKTKETFIAEAGGINVLLGFVLGVLFYIAVNTFYFKSMEYVTEIFALLCSVLIISFISLIDDIMGWKIGLSRKSRLILTLLSAIPLMVINAGESSMLNIELGLLYPLLLIPLGIVATSTTFNFIAGYNGLESSQGILILSALGIVTYITGNSWLSVIAFCMVASLIAFYFFNKFPAKVFPGDSLTYPVGAMIGIIAILGNIEKIAVFFFIPYIIEVILKSRGKLKKESFAKLNKDQSLNLPYKKIYGIEHFMIYLISKIKSKVYERDVVYAINLFQIIIILLGVLLFLT